MRQKLFAAGLALLAHGCVVNSINVAPTKHLPTPNPIVECIDAKGKSLVERLTAPEVNIRRKAAKELSRVGRGLTDNDATVLLRAIEKETDANVLISLGHAITERCVILDSNVRTPSGLKQALEGTIATTLTPKGKMEEIGNSAVEDALVDKLVDLFRKASDYETTYAAARILISLHYSWEHFHNDQNRRGEDSRKVLFVLLEEPNGLSKDKKIIALEALENTREELNSRTLAFLQERFEFGSGEDAFVIAAAMRVVDKILHYGGSLQEE